MYIPDMGGRRKKKERTNSATFIREETRRPTSGGDNPEILDLDFTSTAKSHINKCKHHKITDDERRYR